MRCTLFLFTVSMFLIGHTMCHVPKSPYYPFPLSNDWFKHSQHQTHIFRVSKILSFFQLSVFSHRLLFHLVLLKNPPARQEMASDDGPCGGVSYDPDKHGIVSIQAGERFPFSWRLLSQDNEHPFRVAVNYAGEDDFASNNPNVVVLSDSILNIAEGPYDRALQFPANRFCDKCSVQLMSMGEFYNCANVKVLPPKHKNKWIIFSEEGWSTRDTAAVVLGCVIGSVLIGAVVWKFVKLKDENRYRRLVRTGII
eukprot:TRINITY_DN8080_c0_g1_i2.p1 TRINITY_DN8080_c0_g1~~TRINITY_DN8080_c0_g1_i2.p1  ORF type:complete len:253 (+),score=10.37 TRINITY_DN8080_c0_g1_i2:1-759(+)